MATEPMPLVRMTLDARGRRCALLSFAIAGTIGNVDSGEVLQVLSDDPAAPTEIPAWCRKVGHELLALEQRPDGHRALIRRGH